MLIDQTDNDNEQLDALLVQSRFDNQTNVNFRLIFCFHSFFARVNTKAKGLKFDLAQANSLERLNRNCYAAAQTKRFSQ